MDDLLRYMGKADPLVAGGAKSHPLPYHCLDVAAVAGEWMAVAPVVRTGFCRAFGYPVERFGELRAWVMFFIALHDIGKLHALFQGKLLQALGMQGPPSVASGLSAGYRHGTAGYALAVAEYGDWIGDNDEDSAYFDRWRPWLAAVTGHHGEIPLLVETCGPYAAGETMAADRAARADWVRALASLFLTPAGLSLSDQPPACTDAAQTWLAGFCAVCDWIGSNTGIFGYRAPDAEFASYFQASLRRLRDTGALGAFGLVSTSRPYAGMASLLNQAESPRGIQTIVESLPLAPSLALIEAPTGSGKTEAALAHGWRMMEAGLAESIVFALPTQATANGMLPRAQAFAERAFGSAHVVLAHGKSEFSEAFGRLLAAARPTAQGSEDAAAQCSAWLAQSRKRAFLGQFGVCTIDQALLSVLPVRHKFVRGFGIQRSVLIVDEVHAYDSYMHGLLGELLRQQRAVGGSAILLSATLPGNQRAALFEAWGVEADSDAEAPYPVLWHAGGGGVSALEVASTQRPPLRTVATECVRLPDACPDEALVGRMLDAARAGAKVAVVLNLVDAAQSLARRLRQVGDVPVDIFHSRYRYCDRMEKEREAMSRYGRERRAGGRILVATQVVEQSLDLDFDWLVTHICPVDLLFQRLGRLHRHQRIRPPGFESPRCTVLTVEGDNYGSHAAIYGNVRVLWRTECLLAANPNIAFPGAYRDWIERAYVESTWENEPDRIYASYLAWRDDQRAARNKALQLARQSMSQFRDNDEIAGALTRDGEMSLTVLPEMAGGKTLDGNEWPRPDDRRHAEVVSLNSIPVPASKKWKGALAASYDDEGRCRMLMSADGAGCWVGKNGSAVLRYSLDFGLELERSEHEPA